MRIHPITLERPSPAEAPLQDALNHVLVRDLLHRTRGAGIALLGAVVLMWTIVGPHVGTHVAIQFVALVSLIVVRMVGSIAMERRSHFDAMRVFGGFAAINFLIGGGLGSILITSYPHLPPLAVAMCSVCIIGINSAAMVSLAGSPLVYLLYVGANMAALTFVSFAYPLQGLERPFQIMQFVYGAALLVMMRSVHRSLRNNIVLRLQLGSSLEQLRDAQAQVVEVSRQAGRADVATAVLHSVGNLLNSMNVSAALVVDRLARSRLHGLPKIMGLITQHRGRLDAFLDHDPRGQKLPEYCAQLAEAVERDHGAAQAELDSLTKQIELIKAVIEVQQEHARPAGVLETVEVAAIVDGALEPHAAACQRDAIAVERRVAELPPTTLDRYKVQQILSVLLANARDAVLANHPGQRRIAVDVRRGGDGALEIAVEDNGCGIEPENLERVFSLGYTTKPHRHGTRLHFSACAAREMHGTLVARSRGIGHGAEFVLALPPGAAAAS
ncbi:MAG TPA: HAMP domain-containing sensor histidine kinase [Kofleriaceae bacterium]|nr:HAMP domain-containing sensor histidine kinase [Kofleriaceae bacterium]